MCLALLLAGCGHAQADRTAGGFPKADRPVASVVSSRWSNETDRDRLREFEAVVAASGVRPGMTVADVGAGEGYYTVRLAQKVGPDGRVLAEDIMPAYHDALAARVSRDRLDNVSVKLGRPADAMLPAASFDRIFLVHMYHEIEQPYELLWRLLPSLAKGGLVAVVDADRPTENHGTPPDLLDCEFRSVGFVPVRHVAMPQASGYLALYASSGKRPAPGEIKGCSAK